VAGAILEVAFDASVVGRELELLIERLGSLRTPLNDIA
jgi:hypothetical protein